MTRCTLPFPLIFLAIRGFFIIIFFPMMVLLQSVQTVVPSQVSCLALLLLKTDAAER